ncbi:MAG: AAA domain-containing protein [Syntrophomonas sp.]
MEKQQATYFEALTVNRAESAKALEGFALRGVKNSVIEKYSDQAHFIYELLQNADDARATSARFELFKDKLVFAHNGTRRFTVTDPATEAQDLDNGTLGDINAISAVGGSNKIDEATIGKFGVGFKAVFQYTATPHIFDPDVFFKIERFIVPIRLETDYSGRRNDETLFVFPFDHDKRSAKDAYFDISEKLRSLDYPLLFLANLKDISFEISGILGLYGKTIEETHDFDGTTAEFVRCTHNDGENRDNMYDDILWLFSRDDGEGHTYSVGFFVDAKGHLIPKKHSAFCFFPTKKGTGLNFILHAPFLLTDSREGIQAGVQHNIDMISLLSELAADSLVYLKEIGMTKKTLLIDDNIIDIIPYDESGFTEINSKKEISFKPFYTAIKQAFESETIIPSSNGYVSTGNAYWGGQDNSQLSEVFSNEQLASMSKNNNAKWVFSSLSTPRSGGEGAKYKYIRSLVKNTVTDIGIIDLIDEGFIETQNTDWLHKFYKYISDNKDRTNRILIKPIFLNQDGKAVAAFDTKKQAILFLPTEGGSVYATVSETLLKNEDTLAFVKQLGISEPSLRAEIYNIILPQYKDGALIDPRPHFKKFFRYYQECSQTEAKSFLALIREYAFVLFKSADDATQYRGKAGGLYFPFESLQRWFQPKPDTKFVNFDEYMELVGKDKKEELINFLTDLGVKDVPRICLRILTEDEAYEIKPRYEWSQPASYNMNTRMWTERFIDGCQENIERISQEQDVFLSANLWNQLLKFVEYGYFKDSYYWSRDSVLYGRYQYFYRTQQSESFESSEAIRLRTQPWLINSDGESVSANELTVQTLHPQYDVSSDEAVELFRLLGIMEEVDEEDENIDISSFAESLGFSEEDAKRILKEAYEQKKVADSPNFDKADEADDGDSTEDESEDDAPAVSPSVKRVVKEISKRATSSPKERVQRHDDTVEDTPVDEDDYSKPTVDISKKIEKVKDQAEREIKEIARLEDLKQQAQEADKYSYGWFKALLELESLNSGENNANSREISISFAKVELEEGTSRTLILKHPSRYIPQSMEDLADIPLELHFASQPMFKVAVEVVSVKSYTLRAKLRTNAQITGVDLSLVTEARINAKNPVFLIEELRKAFIKLGDENGFEDDFNMQENLCENIEFVFGPPGTGKTTYLAQDVILSMMRETTDLKVLVLTPTNKAADVLVRRLMDSMGIDHSYLNWLVRFGATNDNTIEQSGVFRDKTIDIRTFARNVTVTTIARFPYDYFLPDDGTRLHINALKWDYIIIDEASMIPLANIVYPLFKKTPEKFIIGGDPFQIEPITTVDVWKNENIYTMVELNSFAEPTTVPYQYHVELLTTQYRSIPEIGEVFSRFAYDGILRHYRSADSQRSLPIGDFFDVKSLNIIKFPVSKYESIYRPKRLQSKTPYQVYSALFAFEFVKCLSSLIELVKGNEQFSIGLIAPYRAQSDLIDKLMTSILWPKNVNVQVGTIHGFQGDECDIIIALFNPPPSITTHKDMFLNKLNIVNVSISRARDYLFILMPDDDTENVGNLTLIKKVECLCKSQPSWSEQQSPDIEEMIFGSKSYLEDNSFSTSHQLVNVYGKPEKQYEVRSEDNAVDVQIHD